MTDFVLGWPFIEKIAITLAIGALLGMEREYTKHQVVVGVRTFALVSLLGTLFVLFSEMTGDTINLVLGFIAVMLLVAILYASNLMKFKAVGMTTCVALLLSYILGVFVAYGNYSEAVFITMAIVGIMFAKDKLHHFISDLTHKEVLDFLEFLALFGIVYPLVPKVPLVLYGVAINLMDTWALIMLLAVMNFIGFVGSRYIKGREQVPLLSFIGALASSTAIIYSLTQMYAKNKEKDRIITSAYMFANSSMILRNLAVLTVLIPAILPLVAVPMLLTAVTLIAFGLYLSRKTTGVIKTELESPFQVEKAAGLVLKLALVMTAIAVITVYLPDIFYIAMLLGGLTSSASTMASLPMLVQTGEITLSMAAIGASLAILIELVVGNVVVCYLGGAGNAAKRAIPWIMAATAVYGLSLSLLV